MPLTTESPPIGQDPSADLAALMRRDAACYRERMREGELTYYRGNMVNPERTVGHLERRPKGRARRSDGGQPS
jgi:hypothetical protein